MSKFFHLLSLKARNANALKHFNRHAETEELTDWRITIPDSACSSKTFEAELFFTSKFINTRQFMDMLSEFSQKQSLNNEEPLSLPCEIWYGMNEQFIVHTDKDYKFNKYSYRLRIKNIEISALAKLIHNLINFKSYGKLLLLYRSDTKKLYKAVMVKGEVKVIDLETGIEPGSGKEEDYASLINTIHQLDKKFETLLNKDNPSESEIQSFIDNIERKELNYFKTLIKSRKYYNENKIGKSGKWLKKQ